MIYGEKEGEEKMTEKKLTEITTVVMDIFRDTKFYDCVWCKQDSPKDCLGCKETDTVYSLLNMIASLHNELYKEVTGKYYDYSYHWANLGYGGAPDDSMFKEDVDNE